MPAPNKSIRRSRAIGAILQRASVLSAFACTALVAFAVDSEAVEGVQINIDPGQPASVVGKSESLRAVVQEVCAGSGIRLLAYDAPDRPVRASYSEATVSKLLGRLLKRESFMLGVTGDADSSDRVTWLRVIGQPGPDGKVSTFPLEPAVLPAVEVVQPPPPEQPAPAPKEEEPKKQVLFSPGVMRELAMVRAGSREVIAEQFGERLRTDADARSRFLDISPTELAEELADNPFARDVLKQFEKNFPDTAALQDHLSKISNEHWRIVRRRAAEKQR